MIESFSEKGVISFSMEYNPKDSPSRLEQEGKDAQRMLECVYAEFYHVFSWTLCVRLKQGGLCVCQNLLFLMGFL